MNTAVLFLVFNRPDMTQMVFEAIRQAKPARLYIAADGPRANRVGESEFCAESRRIATAVDWPCDVHTLFRESNHGCKVAVSAALTWFFTKEEEGIILEDDVVPSGDFFSYCEILLKHYRNEPKVMMVSGCNPVSNQYNHQHSYDFSLYGLVWGWASWRRAWALYDVNMIEWPEYKKNKELSKLPVDKMSFSYIWTHIFDRTYNNEIDTWDYQWFFSIFKNRSFIIVPSKNHVINLGYDENATHSVGACPAWVKQLKVEGNLGRIAHPLEIKINPEINRLIGKVVFMGGKNLPYMNLLVIGSQMLHRLRSFRQKTLIWLNKFQVISKED